jgi:hypothetical protein
VPADTGVINPELLIVAIPVDPEDHVPPDVPFVVKVVVPFEQIACVPVNVPADAGAVTVILPEATTQPEVTGIE